jgi:hypothetical protein
LCAVEATFTIRAGALAMMRSDNNSVSTKGPRWLIPKVASTPSSVSRRSESTSPALLTSTSMRGQRARMASAPRRTEDRLPRSKTTRSTDPLPERAVMSATAASPLVLSLAVMTVSAPARARATAVSSPIPELPPVMTTVLPAMSGTSTVHTSAVVPVGF